MLHLLYFILMLTGQSIAKHFLQTVSPTFSRQKAVPFIADWFSGPAWKNNSKLYT